jgi:GT2 family glycosyltransferase
MAVGYESLVGDSEWLKAMPFEHRFRRVPHDAFVARLIEEHGLFVSSLSFVPKLTLVIYATENLVSFRRTMESCLWQSAVHFNILIIAPYQQILHLIKREVQNRLYMDLFLKRSFEARIFFSESVSSVDESEWGAGYLVCLKTGDVLHPSCVTSIYLEINQLRGSDVVIWNEMHVAFRTDAQVVKCLRKPLFEPYTLFHLNYVGNSFAFRSAFISWFPDFDACLLKHDFHYFLLSIVKEKHCNFVTIPQHLLLRDVDHVQSHSYPDESRIGAHQAYFHDLGFTFKPSANALTYSLVPKRTAKKISVIIPFRDRVELTCKALKSVINQDAESDIEIILINNQSDARSVECIRSFLKSAESSTRMGRVLDYDKPFNHSAECNLGALEAGGDCVVFMNNDAQLLSRTALSEMAAWCLLPDVGTVGVQMLKDLEGTSVSAGITARQFVGSEFNSPVEESQDLNYAGFNRQTWGNSFACAAIAKKKFELVGPLDEVDFPNGYNDVDYSMRCRKAGLVNIYLGTISVYHNPGSSRGRYDEIHQKILLRRKFPEIYRDGLFQLALEERLAIGDHSSSISDSSKGYLHKISRAIRTRMGIAS